MKILTLYYEYTENSDVGELIPLLLYINNMINVYNNNVKRTLQPNSVTQEILLRGWLISLSKIVFFLVF